MQLNKSFHAAYLELENQMRLLAEIDGHAYLPNVAPDGPVNYILICMEPSLGRWARSVEQARVKVKEGFRNFLPSDETSLLHFSIQRYLCGTEQRYHITDLSKGAMLVEQAGNAREIRYDRWYALLQEEIDLVATPNARIIAVGSKVFQYLKNREFQRPYTQIIHYSGLAGSARTAGIKGREDDFQEYKVSISHEEIVATAKVFLKHAQVPAKIHDETIKRLMNFQLTDSRKQLIFNYKTAFEKLLS